MKPAYVQQMIDNNDTLGLVECGLFESAKESLTVNQDQLLSYLMMEGMTTTAKEDIDNLERETIQYIAENFNTDALAHEELSSLLAW